MQGFVGNDENNRPLPVAGKFFIGNSMQKNEIKFFIHDFFLVFFFLHGPLFVAFISVVPSQLFISADTL